MCLWCCVVSYWIFQAVWRQAGRPQWGEGCRPRGHSGRKARPGRRDLPGTPLPQCFQTPGEKTHAGISHPLAGRRPTTEMAGDNGSTVKAFKCTEARPPSHIHKSCTLRGALCGPLERRRRGNTLMCVCSNCIHKAFLYVFSFFLIHTHIYKPRF